MNYMRTKITLLNRIVAMVLAISFIMPILPLQYIDLRFGTHISKNNAFVSEVKAFEATKAISDGADEIIDVHPVFFTNSSIKTSFILLLFSFLLYSKIFF